MLVSHVSYVIWTPLFSDAERCSRRATSEFERCLYLDKLKRVPVSDFNRGKVGVYY